MKLYSVNGELRFLFSHFFKLFSRNFNQFIIHIHSAPIASVLFFTRGYWLVICIWYFFVSWNGWLICMDIYRRNINSFFNESAMATNKKTANIPDEIKEKLASLDTALAQIETVFQPLLRTSQSELYEKVRFILERIHESSEIFMICS